MEQWNFAYQFHSQFLTIPRFDALLIAPRSHGRPIAMRVSHHFHLRSQAHQLLSARKTPMHAPSHTVYGTRKERPANAAHRATAIERATLRIRETSVEASKLHSRVQTCAHSSDMAERHTSS